MKRRRPKEHIRKLKVGPGRRISRPKIINKGITYHPSNRKMIRKLFKVMRPSDMKNIPQEGYIFEPKYDGSRGLFYAIKGLGQAFINRRDIDATSSYPELFNAHEQIRNAKSVVLDGEVVVLTKNRPYGDFRLLSGREHMIDSKEILEKSKNTPIKFVAFDILERDGKDLTSLPLKKRRKILDLVVPDKSEDFLEVKSTRNGKELLNTLRTANAEGIVAKKENSTYKEGSKTKDWLKGKLLKENDVAIIGYTKGEGKREGIFGALIMGVWDKDGYNPVGKVGTGFTDNELKNIYSKINGKESRNTFIKKKTDFKFIPIKPEFVARVNFLNETEAGNYREPRFVSIRSDITPQQTHKSIVPVQGGID